MTLPAQLSGKSPTRIWGDADPAKVLLFRMLVGPKEEYYFVRGESTSGVSSPEDPDVTRSLRSQG